MSKKKANTVAKPAATAARRPRLSQEDVPGHSLDQALRVSRAIAENYAYKPTRPMHVASAMKMTPTSGPFRGITGASIAYGLTAGGAKSSEIAITPLGMRVVRPTTEGDDLAARRDALLRPKVVGEFLRAYDGAALPADNIAKNVLQSKGVPAERVVDVLDLIIEGASAVGFLHDVSGKRWVDLSGTTGPVGPAPEAPIQVSGANPPGPAQKPSVSVGPGVHVNIEIHIAADASSQVIEDIFRNMRRYVLSGDGPIDEE